MNKKQKNNLIRCIIALILVVALSIAFHFIEVPWWIELPTFLIPYFVVGYDVLLRAFKNIRNGQVFDECFLMTIATVGAIATGEYREGVAVMLFYQIGELFQSIAVGKSRKNIADLMDICPEIANVFHEDGTITEEDPDDVEIGSIIVVNPGERVPIDGIIIEGDTSLDTSALTGESVPRAAHPDDEIISGCISLTGMIKIKTTKQFEDSTVSKILEMVENSSMRKAQAENFISKFAKYYTPIVCYSALALFLLPPVVRLILGMPGNWTDWLMRALTFLVISCPCAVVISVPLSFFGGIGCASSRGILVKGSNYLEALADTDTIVFDKTGTLTKGVFEVQEIYTNGDVSRDYLLERAANAESSSNHPIAESILRAYKYEFGNEINYNLIYDAEEIAGHGVSIKFREIPDGVIESVDKENTSGKEAHFKIYAGNIRLMKKMGVTVPEEHDEGTVVYVAESYHSVSSDDEVEPDNNVKYLGCIVIADELKSTSRDAMQGLSKQGIKTIMLTGDSDKAAKLVAEKVGVSQYKSELLPGDKVEEVEKLLDNQKGTDSKRKRLAFVGDGINDAPVLARADIGIAMGAMGSDAAIEAADIVLMDDDPSKIALAMKISRKTLKIVKQNITFAIAVKVLCLLLGALGIANMWIAIFADVGVMVIAVLNATRTLNIRVR
ncbi:MAG: heavy metal translocating P-type ATPase [Eubacterium sp.]|nr:heavy metal translocating P-type ATPase [Eubacterium sp.]